MLPIDIFATVDEVQSRLDWEMSTGERGVALGALEDLSIDARYYGRPQWDSSTRPERVKSLVLRAAVRFVKNHEGMSESRAGDESVGWAAVDRQPDTAEFTSREIDELRALAGSNGFGTADVYTWGTGGRNSEELFIAAQHKEIPFVHPDDVPFYK